jgi:UDP-glucose 4-epimerase
LRLRTAAVCLGAGAASLVASIASQGQCPPVAIVLTGVGYIGLPLLRQLQARGEHVVALDNFFSTPRELLPSDVEVLDGDVSEPAAVARAFQRASSADEKLLVYHLAAQPSAAVAARDPGYTERTNLVGARVVLEAARQHGAGVVFGGSFRVYGDDLSGQTVDEDTPYGRVGDLSHLSKLYVEQLARMIGLPFVSVRLGVTYGLGPLMKTHDPAFMTVPNLFCQHAARGEVLHVLADRPLAFIHVHDAVSALLLAGERVSGSEVVNAAPEVATVGQVARTVQRLGQERGLRVCLDGAAASEATFRVRSRLPLQPAHTLEQSLGEVLDFFLA